jgi:hypothetical protein
MPGLFARLENVPMGRYSPLDARYEPRNVAAHNANIKMHG